MASIISAVIAAINFFIVRFSFGGSVIVGCVGFDFVGFPAKNVGSVDSFPPTYKVI
tara:strand:- start:1206 stop:1373 length:168 start_codon:yes stop_codon:yes gene_type:complete